MLGVAVFIVWNFVSTLARAADVVGNVPRIVMSCHLVCHVVLNSAVIRIAPRRDVHPAGHVGTARAPICAVCFI